MSVEVEVDTRAAQQRIMRMVTRAGDFRPLMNAFGRYMLVSVRRNFDVGGRPMWEPLKNWQVVSADVKRSRWNKFRRQQGRARMGGPLVLTGDLRRHIGYRAEPNDLVLYARPQEDTVKAPVHQWGTNRAGRSRNVTIPARPYLVFQAEDVRYFRKLASAWIRVGDAGMK